MFGCCYLPVIDYAIMLDYSPEKYSTFKKLYESDSVDIEISAIANFPNKQRSRNRKIFLVGCNLEVKKNLYPDTLKIDINKAVVSAVFSSQTLTGDPKVNLVDAQVERKIYLIGNQVIFLEGNHMTGGVVYQFRYPKELKKSLRDHRLNLDFKKIEIGNEYLELNPIILELN